MGFKIQKKLVIEYGWIKILSIFLDQIWRHGQVVRRGTANPLSPVQIRVSPDQQKT